jgi:hypothetical protein
MKAFSIVACILCVLVALFLAFMTFNELYFFGFPDSHVTDYQKAAEPPLRLLGWAEVGLAVVFLALVFPSISTRVRTVVLLVAVIALILVALAVHVGVPWYFGTHLGLDNGIGG